MSAANRRRGHDAERAVVRYLRANGYPDACTTRAKLGHDGAHAPGDIDFHPLVALEVKDVAASAWPTWCRQAVAEAGDIPIPAVVRRTRGVPDPGAWECRYRTDALRPPHPIVEVDGESWVVCTLADLVALLLALDEGVVA